MFTYELAYVKLAMRLQYIDLGDNMTISKIGSVAASYYKVAQYTKQGPKGATVVSNPAVEVSISKEAKALAQAAEEQQEQTSLATPNPNELFTQD